MPVRKDDVIREVMSMQGVGFQVAKAIVNHAVAPDDVYKQIGASGWKRAWSAQEARRVTAAATERIALVDEGD